MKNLNKKKKAKFFYLQEFLKLLGKKPSKIQPREAPDFLSQVMPPPEHLEYLLRSFSKFNKKLRKSKFTKVYIYQYMFDVVYE